MDSQISHLFIDEKILTKKFMIKKNSSQFLRKVTLATTIVTKTTKTNDMPNTENSDAERVSVEI